MLNPASNVATSLSAMIGTNDLNAYLASKPKDPPVGVNHEPFYHNLFKLWDLLHGFDPREEDSIRKEVIWGNKRITPGGSPLHRPLWESKGIHTVHDICHPTENRLLSHEELSIRYDVTCSFLDMLSIRLSIPLAWRQSLSSNWSTPPDPSSRSGIYVLLPEEQPKDILNVSPKQLYRAFIHLLDHTGAAYKKWLELPDQTYRIQDLEEWNDICLSVYRASRETKLQAFHFKIINRIIPCKKFLQQIRIADSDACDFCGDQDSLTHFFCDCPHNRPFWNSVFRWFARIEDLRLEDVSSKHRLLGLPRIFPNAKKINAILISVKFYIYRQRLFHLGQMDLLHWLREFRSRLGVYREILRRENKLSRFAQWTRILQSLG